MSIAWLAAESLVVGTAASGATRSVLSAVGQIVIVATLAALAILLIPQRIRKPSGGVVPGPASARPARSSGAEADGPHPWEPELGRIGVCCSGGGIRSASFCLGALQSLRNAGILARASYVTAVSGGSYIASAYAITLGESTKSGEPVQSSESGASAPFSPGSPEERWLRGRTNYLSPTLQVGLSGVVRLLAGLAVNLVLIWLLMFLVARPIGWLISAPGVHPELKAREPIVRIVSEPRSLGITLEALDQPTAEGATHLIRARFSPGSAELSGARWRDEMVSVSVQEERPGLGVVRDATFSVLRQPDVVALDPVQDLQVNGTRSASIDIGTDPIVRYLSSATIDSDTTLGQIQSRMGIVREPALQHRSGLTGRPAITIDPWMWATVGLLAAIAATGYLFHMLFGALTTSTTRAARHVVTVAAALAGGAFLVLIAVPVAVERIPRVLASVIDVIPWINGYVAADGFSLTDAVPAAMGFFGLALVAVRSFLYRTTRTSPLRLIRFLAAIIVPIVGTILFVQLVRMAAANGPLGALAGFNVGISPLPDYSRWLAVVAVLLVFRYLADAHAWSLAPHYKRRLSTAFAVRRSHDAGDRVEHVEEVPYDDKPLPFFEYGQVAEGLDGTAGPQLIVCAAANVRDQGIAPPGRKSVSFTFSSTEIGGPQVGWVETKKLWFATSRARRMDQTVLAAMAISGAAISPALGKLHQRGLGRLLAVLNVRLGVWFPHPQWIASFITEHRHETDLAAGSIWANSPGWPYLIREILGRFRFDNKYLYITDGGHWENLGLVELLRRGCTEVYCISAAGDGPHSFATIAEAVALAREELGVEFDDLELSPLRPPLKRSDATQADAPSARQLLRPTGVGLAPAAFATAPYVTARFRYPASSSATDAAIPGRIVFIDANLTSSVPWDVHAYAEQHHHFPDHSTLDQFFDHRQFESYRQLGHHQMGAALTSDAWHGLAPPAPVSKRKTAVRRTAAARAETNDEPVQSTAHRQRLETNGPSSRE